MALENFKKRLSKVKKAFTGEAEEQLIGRGVIPKNHTLYEVNIQTLEYEVAEKQHSGNADTVKGARYKLVMKPGYSYVSALNEKNLRRKLGLTNRK